MRPRTVDLAVVAEERLGVIDLTPELRRAVATAGVREGLVLAFCRHTTCTLLLNEWEEGAIEDIRRRIEDLAPLDATYLHDDLERRTRNLESGHERPNGRSHVAQMLLGGSSQVIPISAGAPALGRWQRLMLLELDEPKPRTVTLKMVRD